MRLEVKPTYLKQKAKKLKKEEGITHTDALNRVAQEYGYSNYRHYLNESEIRKQQQVYERSKDGSF